MGLTRVGLSWSWFYRLSLYGQCSQFYYVLVYIWSFNSIIFGLILVLVLYSDWVLVLILVLVRSWPGMVLVLIIVSVLGLLLVLVLFLVDLGRVW